MWRKRVGLILLIWGALTVVINTIILALSPPDELTNGMLNLAFWGIAVSIGFILFVAGWFLYPRKKMSLRTSCGWLIFTIGLCFEIICAIWLVPGFLKCIGPQAPLIFNWCEKGLMVRYLVPWLGGPAIVMVLGLMMVYIKKKDKNTQPRNRVFSNTRL